MNDRQVPGRTEETEVTRRGETSAQRPFWVVGLPLLGLLLVILTGAFALNRQFQPRVGIEPIPTAAATPRPTAQALLVATATISAPTVTVVSSQLPTQTPTQREVEAAYQKYLDVYAQAVADLDTSHLTDVLDGQALQWVTDEVNDLKAQGRPVKVIEDERLLLFGRTTDTSATLVDEYISRSVYVDPATKQPLSRSTPPTRVRQSYEFRKIGGVWKIVDGTRETLSGGTP